MIHTSVIFLIGSCHTVHVLLIRYGRRLALSLSIYLMSLPTAAVGCLPTFEQVTARHLHMPQHLFLPGFGHNSTET
jgi:hypothetical protein